MFIICNTSLPQKAHLEGATKIHNWVIEAMSMVNQQPIGSCLYDLRNVQ